MATIDSLASEAAALRNTYFDGYEFKLGSFYAKRQRFLDTPGIVVGDYMAISPLFCKNGGMQTPRKRGKRR